MQLQTLSKSITMNKKKSLLLLPLFQFCGAFSQTGIFYWNDTLTSNNWITSIAQTPKGDIYMAGTVTDADDKNPQPIFIRTDKNGMLLVKKVVEAPGLFQLIDFLLLPKASNCNVDCYSLKLFGTKAESGVPSFYTQPLSANGEPQGTEATLSNSPQIMGDIAPINDSENYFSFSRHSTGYPYNVRLIKEKYREVKDASFPGFVAMQEKYIAIHSDNNELCQGVIPDSNEFVFLFCSRNYSANNADAVLYKISLKTDSIVWTREISSRMNIATPGIFKGSNNTLIMLLNYSDNLVADSGKTRLLQINMTTGDTVAINKSFNLRSSGLLMLKNGNYVLYGGRLQTNKDLGNNVSIKGKWIVLDKNFNTVKEDEMGMFDEPDATLPSLAMTVNPTMSELNKAVQLSDGRIAFAGRVYMPNHTSPNEIIYSRYYNKPMLFITDQSGNFRKE